MEKITLQKPNLLHAAEVMAYREEMLQNNQSFDGCAGLEEVETFAQWLNFEGRLSERYKEQYVPSKVFLAVRENDSRVVGIIDFRYPLSDFLFAFGGNIGYSVRPSERKKGYASEMLKLLLPICRESLANKVLITCDKNNLASQKVIVKNGGVLEKEIADTVGLSQSGIILRYWIDLAP